MAVTKLNKTQVGLENVDNTPDASKNVLSASKLTTARTISLTGDATGSVSFDGSSDATITITGIQPKLDAKQDKYTTTTTDVSKTLSNLERCSVTAAGQTITLPPSPSIGWEVTVIVGNFFNTVIDRNGQTIMGISENMIIDRPNVTVSLLFVGANGWRIF